MRWLTAALVALIVALQYPLWLGKGGWLRVWDVDRQLQQQREANHKLEARNAGLDAEVRDLKQGYDAIEERARYELGMVKEDEVFVQLPEQSSAASPTPGIGFAAPATPPGLAAAKSRPARPAPTGKAEVEKFVAQGAKKP